jgi:hypothetical protein
MQMQAISVTNSRLLSVITNLICLDFKCLLRHIAIRPVYEPNNVVG